MYSILLKSNIKALLLLFLSIMLLLISLGSNSAMGQEALNAIKKPLDQGMDLLKDPKYNDSSLKAEQRNKMWSLIREAFDFRDVSRSALAKNWERFSAAEQKEFIDIFAELMGQTYIEKIQGAYSSETVEYLKEELVSDNRGVVKTLIVRKGGEIPVDYKVRKRNNEWRIYDVRVEGVSLVKNYRTQFNKYLFKKSPRDLINEITVKVDKKKGESNSASISDISQKIAYGYNIWGGILPFSD